MLESLERSIIDCNGIIKVVNTTPHPVTLVTGDLTSTFHVEASGVLINATAKTEILEEKAGIKFQQTSFVADEATKQALVSFKESNPEVVIIGSLIAAQAYPGLVCAMVAHPEFLRVPPQEKKMLVDTYTIY